MPRFAANLTFLFTEIPFMERFAAARRAGLKAVEFMFPYDFNQEEIKAQLRETGLQLILCNLPAGNWAGGDRGTAANPERKEEFREGVAKGIDAARTLGVDRLNCLVGLKNQALSDGETWQTLKENIRYAAESLQQERIRLMVEPINHLDVPGFALNTCGQVLKLLRETAHPNAYLQFDVYHARRENENVAAILRDQLDRIGHIQIADCPGRHQPGTGETDFKLLLAEIDRVGYDGFVSMEYIPAPDTQSSLAWLSSHGYSL
ncbi:MAG: TIM barrel protein [Proteobacteria bacterium]|nr:TIM barrel protein [Pseudomonadota bacterium]